MAQFQANAVNYTTVLKLAIKRSFTSPPINISQIQNFTVTSASGSLRTRRLGAGSNAIVASYSIAINSKFPATAYSTQLAASVDSGSFNSYVVAAATNLKIPSVNITSGPIAVGKQTHHDSNERH